MKISLSWLKNYLPKLGSDSALISDVLTQGGLEVEGLIQYSSVMGSLDGVVVGEVVACMPHPAADRLKLTKVNTGTENLLSIVCGAPNVAIGQKVLVAKVGSKLTFSSGEVIQIKKSKIRGEESEGMICAEDELGLGKNHDGIMVLDAHALPGTPAEEYLNIFRDTVFEIGITPNRSDALSHLGVARDLHACLKSRNIESYFSVPVLSKIDGGANNDEIKISVKTPHCIRYAGAVIHGISVSESPAWLKNMISAIGLRPINNIVDITNYIMHDLGQPLHAFDLNSIRGNKVVIREAIQGEKLVTLDGVERTLSNSNMMICDEIAPMCLAGIFGGISSGVKESSVSVFLESACFSPVSIRKSAKEHGLKTDASYRYERGTDPHMVLPALSKAVELIRQIAGAHSAYLVADICPVPIPAAEVVFSHDRFCKFVGQNIPQVQTEQILSDLGISISPRSNNEYLLQIPNYKTDVTREVDVFEEVLRVYGYNRIQEKTLLSVPVQSQTSVSGLPEKLRDFFSLAGFFEVMNLSMTSEKNSLKGKEEQAIKLNNPLSSELSVMRQSLIFGMLENALYNRNRQSKNIRLFELGRQYHQAGGFKEEQRLGILCGGSSFDESWVAKAPDADFYFIKGVLQALAQKLGLSNILESQKEMEFGLATVFEIQTGKVSNWVWQIMVINDSITQDMGLEGSFFYAEINIPFLISIGAPLKSRFTELPRFPRVRRDLALIVDKEVEFSQMEILARKAENKILKEVNLFDVYEGKNIPQGKKSYALSFILSNNDATLNDTQIEKAMERIIKSFRENLAAELRV